MKSVKCPSVLKQDYCGYWKVANLLKYTSIVQKTDVRVLAPTNVDLPKLIKKTALEKIYTIG